MPRHATAFALLAAVLAGCAPRPPAPVPRTDDRLVLQPVGFDALAGWQTDRQGEALEAFTRSCAVLGRQPNAIVNADDWRAVCADAARLDAADHAASRGFLERRFQPYLVTDRGEALGLFTGYFEIELNGSRSRSSRFGIPIYRRPPELVTVELGRFRDELSGTHLAGRVANAALVPFASRREIAAGGLAGRGLELVWVDDAADAFFLAVQGSGRVRLGDGTVMRLGYAAGNGHPYRSIGAELARRGAVPRDQVTMQSIRAWLRANPAEAQALFDTNPSYVFFREIEGAGPVGSQGVALVAGRSLAVDSRFIPLGAPLWLDTSEPGAPDSPDSSDRKLRRLVIAQDTGSAIQGPVRGDVFFGAGPQAAERAGAMKQPGRYFLLLPRRS